MYEAGYYAVALHELAHWTGHKNRLNRNTLGHSKVTPDYAREELRAESAAWMLCMELGIDHNPRLHLNYLVKWHNWYKRLMEKDRWELNRAARDAEQIKEYLMEKVHMAETMPSF